MNPVWDVPTNTLAPVRARDWSVPLRLLLHRWGKQTLQLSDPKQIKEVNVCTFPLHFHPRPTVFPC